jgi:hypothetical protein
MAVVFSLLLAGHWRRKAAQAAERQAELEAHLTDLKDRSSAPSAPQATPEGKRLVSEAEFLELMRLRSEVARLKREAAEQGRRLELALRAAATNAAPAAAASAPPDILERDPSEWANGVPREAWSYRAHGSPEAAVETVAWAMREGNVDLFLDSLTPDSRVRLFADLNTSDPAEVARKIQDDVAKIQTLMLGEFKERSERRATFTVISHEGVGDDGAHFKSEQVMHFIRGRGGWRLSLDGEE